MTTDLQSRIYGSNLKDIVPSKELFKSVGIWMTKMIKQLNKTLTSLPGVNAADAIFTTHCLPILMTHDEQQVRGWCLDISAQVSNGLRVQALCFLEADSEGQYAIRIIDPNLVSEWNYDERMVQDSTEAAEAA